MATSSTTHLFRQPDGANTEYEISGAQFLGKRTLLVLVNGMTMVRGDWERLSRSLSQHRPVLTFDHRGLGGSSFPPDGKPKISLEIMARDLLNLLTHSNLKKVAICGYSMGGAITQSFLFLPHHPTRPTPIPFEVTHVFLMSTLCKQLADNGFGKAFKDVLISMDRETTLAERRELARPVGEATFDPKWIEQNKERYSWWLDNMNFGTAQRPVQTLMMQARAVGSIDFGTLHSKLSRNTKFLVVHGTLDQIIPFSSSRVILRSIPWAKEVVVGPAPGQLPNLEFGHQWFEYFDIKVWRAIFEDFMADDSTVLMSRL